MKSVYSPHELWDDQIVVKSDEFTKGKTPFPIRPYINTVTLVKHTSAQLKHNLGSN